MQNRPFQCVILYINIQQVNVVVGQKGDHLNTLWLSAWFNPQHGILFLYAKS